MCGAVSVPRISRTVALLAIRRDPKGGAAQRRCHRQDASPCRLAYLRGRRAGRSPCWRSSPWSGCWWCRGDVGLHLACLTPDPLDVAESSFKLLDAIEQIEVRQRPEILQGERGGRIARAPPQIGEV